MHYQKVMLFVLYDITQLCSFFDVLPTQTYALRPIPNNNEHSRWQWSSNRPPCPASIVLNLLNDFYFCIYPSMKGISEQNLSAWCGESIPLTPYSGLTSLGSAMYILS